MNVICLLGGQDEHRFQQNKKIGSRKSAVDYRKLLWINRHMSISEWEARCLLLHFSASYVIQFYMLDNCMLFFLSLEWSWKKYLLFLWKFKASMLLCYGSCFLLHSSLGSLKQFNLMFLEVYFWQSSPVLGRLHDH